MSQYETDMVELGSRVTFGLVFENCLNPEPTIKIRAKRATAR